MEIINRKIYIANDGNEFVTEEECLKWENRKFLMDPINFRNEDIINLISIIHSEVNGQDVDTTVRIEICSENLQGTGFSYRLTIGSKEELYNDRYEGIITGYNDFELIHDNGVEKNNYIAHCGFSLKRVNEYLQSIGYWEEKTNEPIQNPDITDEWKVIHERSIKGSDR